MDGLSSAARDRRRLGTRRDLRRLTNTGTSQTVSGVSPSTHDTMADPVMRNTCSVFSAICSPGIRCGICKITPQVWPCPTACLLQLATRTRSRSFSRDANCPLKAPICVCHTRRIGMFARSSEGTTACPASNRSNRFFGLVECHHL